MPVIHRNVRYNCRILILNGKILFIRPKTVLAADGNYRENRYFTPWTSHKLENLHLPLDLQELQGTLTVPIGEVLLSLKDTTLGCETCQELFEVNAPHSGMSLNGCEIFTNSSGSEWNLRKLDTRLSLILEATRKAGGVYLYANSRGCDGERSYFDGSCMIILNGQVIAQGAQFSLKEVEVISSTIDLDEVRAVRCTPSRGLQATQAPHYERLEIDFKLSATNATTNLFPTKPVAARYHLPEEEIALGPACYLWDYLRRCGASGFLLPLSGGIDSCATATIVHSMCRMVISAINDGEKQVIADVRRLNRHSEDLPKTPQELANILFCTVYMGMKTQSSKETQLRASKLAEVIGSYHQEVWIDDCFSAFKNIFVTATGYEPRFTVHGGNNASNLALQNIQARSRMVCAYEFAQLIPTSRWGDNVPGMLVLGSANVDECLRGYLTKYDCSSADINPIGSISKTDLKRLIKWAVDAFSIPVLKEFLEATPTAELEPITKEYVQSDEAQMGMTYDELSTFGKLRKENKLGPLGMFQRLVHEWKDEKGLEPRQVAEKVKRFYHCTSNPLST